MDDAAPQFFRIDFMMLPQLRAGNSGADHILGGGDTAWQMLATGRTVPCGGLSASSTPVRAKQGAARVGHFERHQSASSPVCRVPSIPRDLQAVDRCRTICRGHPATVLEPGAAHESDAS